MDELTKLKKELAQLKKQKEAAKIQKEINELKNPSKKKAVGKKVADFFRPRGNEKDKLKELMSY